MNERFKELLKQSTNPPWDGEQGPMNEFNLERFAELIVKECADFLKDTLDDHFAAEQLEEHFGVESE
jgi:hypothetical protein